MTVMNRREQAGVFYQRVTRALVESGMSRSDLARASGLDRSTLTQLLAPGASRLPRADTAAAIASALQESLDWLLGLTHDRAGSAAVLEHVLKIEPSTRMPADAKLLAWQEEAKGYKIRYVPTNLPDMLKVPAVIEYEYADFSLAEPAEVLGTSTEQLTYARMPETDVEICCPAQALETFAIGCGIWSNLPRAARLDQLRHMVALVDELYPTLRWFLFNGLEHYSAALTVFGPERAAIYVGNMYLVFTTTEHIRLLTRHFDDMIRAAIVQPTEISDFISGLIQRLESSEIQGNGS